jgi:23S rRNA (cytosine1962-C5)-methyltransferase
MIFPKTRQANQSLGAQFATRRIQKKYVFLTDRDPGRDRWTSKSHIVRGKLRYESVERGDTSALAETGFQVVKREGATWKIEARPLTGRTHQIRLHASAAGCPILGDILYDGTPARRVHLHSEELEFSHPHSGNSARFAVNPDFEADPRALLRRAFIRPETTNAFRALHGHSDGTAGVYAEALGDFGLIQAEHPLSREEVGGIIGSLQNAYSLKTLYFKALRGASAGRSASDFSPRLLSGAAADGPFTVMENGLRYQLSFQEGYSYGLFLDQRDNRARLRNAYAGIDLPLRPKTGETFEMLNAFAYTCGFSVAAASAGARTTSIDLSKRYLEWGKANFALNNFPLDGHDFIYGDVFGWLRRLGKKGRRYDLVCLDPPTFSRNDQGEVFRVEEDFPRLVKLASALLKEDGVLFASSNSAGWKPQSFLDTVTRSYEASGRKLHHFQYYPQPPDFPISREEPAYLKTVWLR